MAGLVLELAVHRGILKVAIRVWKEGGEVLATPTKITKMFPRK